MSLLSPIKDHHSERQLFISRVILSSIVSIVLLGIVTVTLAAGFIHAGQCIVPRGEAYPH